MFFSFDELEYVVQVPGDLDTWSNFATAAGTGSYFELELSFAAPEGKVFCRIYSQAP